MGRQSGQATIEWLGTIALVAFAFCAVVATVPRPDGRSLGGLLAHRIACGAARSCADGDSALRQAYGPEDAALVRRYLPALVYEPGERQVPVDWRRCRAAACAIAPDERDLDVHRTASGNRVTVFTHLVREDGRRFIQYWLYYPDSNTTWARSDRIWRHSAPLKLAGLILRGTTAYPGFHRDDWEAAVVRVDAEGQAQMRVSSHGAWQWCKQSRCRDRWGPWSGWTRVSRGSHAGHVPVEDDVPALPGHALNERTTTADAVRLIPLESVDRRSYRRLDPDIAPPWSKGAYTDPLSSGS